MRRRSVLAAVAALVAGSGCARVVGDDPVDVRVMRASEDDIEGADAGCRLSASFLDAHHVLKRTLDAASTAPVGEWVTDGTDRDTGEAVADALRDRCEQVGERYLYDGDPYRIRVVEDESGDALLEGAAEFGSD